MNKTIQEQIAKIVFDLAVRAKEESPDFIWLDPYTDQILSLMVKELEGMLSESTVDGTTDYELFAEKVISLLDTSPINTKLGLKTSSICTKPGKTTSTVKGKFKYKIE